MRIAILSLLACARGFLAPTGTRAPRASVLTKRQAASDFRQTSNRASSRLSRSAIWQLGASASEAYSTLADSARNCENLGAVLSSSADCVLRFEEDGPEEEDTDSPCSIASDDEEEDTDSPCS